jgi:hypothetical protein
MSALSAALPVIDDKQRLEMKKLKDEAIAFEGGRQFDEATDKYEALLVKQEGILGDGHSETLETKASLMRVIDEKINKRGIENGTFIENAITAQNLLIQGRFEDSLLLSEQAVEKLTKTLGSDHLDTLTATNDMALAMIELPRYAEKGLSVLKSVLGKRLILLEQDHLDSLNTMHNVGWALNSSSATKRASPFLSK